MIAAAPLSIGTVGPSPQHCGKRLFLGLAKDAYGQQRAGFETEITLNRKDFGLNWNAPLEMGGFLVGDEVKVSLSIQAVAKA